MPKYDIATEIATHNENQKALLFYHGVIAGVLWLISYGVVFGLTALVCSWILGMSVWWSNAVATAVLVGLVWRAVVEWQGLRLHDAWRLAAYGLPGGVPAPHPLPVQAGPPPADAPPAAAAYYIARLIAFAAPRHTAKALHALHERIVLDEAAITSGSLAVAALGRADDWLPLRDYDAAAAALEALERRGAVQRRAAASTDEQTPPEPEIRLEASIVRRCFPKPKSSSGGPSAPGSSSSGASGGLADQIFANVKRSSEKDSSDSLTS